MLVGRKRTLAAILCALMIVGGLSLFLATEPTIQTTTQETSSTMRTAPELQVRIFQSHREATFPRLLNVTSVVENTGNGSVRLIDVVQKVPDEFEVESTEVVNDHTILPIAPSATSDGLSYSLSVQLEPGERAAFIVFLEPSSESEPTSLFETEATGEYNHQYVTSQATTDLSSGLTSTCTDDASISFEEFRLENDVWGGPNEPHRQCVFFRHLSFGWNFTRLSPKPYPKIHLPYYPEVIYGKKPWSETNSTTPRLPIAVDSIESLEAELSASIRGYSKYNFAFDIWITDNERSDSPNTLTDEIMIWFVWSSGLPYTDVIDRVNDGYNTYIHTASRTDLETDLGQVWWMYHQFTIEKQGIPSKVNILSFINHLRHEGRQLRYLASVELGNEVWSGTGETSFTRYRMDLRIKQNPSDPLTWSSPFSSACGLPIAMWEGTFSQGLLLVSEAKVDFFVRRMTDEAHSVPG